MCGHCVSVLCVSVMVFHVGFLGLLWCVVCVSLCVIVCHGVWCGVSLLGAQNLMVCVVHQCVGTMCADSVCVVKNQCVVPMSWK